MPKPNCYAIYCRDGSFSASAIRAYRQTEHYKAEEERRRQQVRDDWDEDSIKEVIKGFYERHNCLPSMQQLNGHFEGLPPFSIAMKFLGRDRRNWLSMVQGVQPTDSAGPSVDTQPVPATVTEEPTTEEPTTEEPTYEKGAPVEELVIEKTDEQSSDNTALVVGANGNEEFLIEEQLQLESEVEESQKIIVEVEVKINLPNREPIKITFTTTQA
ncbi:hypothetical protein IKF34_01350 [Candidatus Saccharibacteria bacterium]|nr:hypothetical protein [Candidatus Saccharibacteria bacterium]